MKILKFYKENCSPCNTMKKVLRNTEYEIEEVNVNLPENKALVLEYGVDQVPTFAISKEYPLLVGAKPLYKFNEWVEAYVHK